VAGDDQDGQREVALGQQALQLQPAHAGHAHVQHQGAGAQLLGRRQRGQKLAASG
jgi:hypothetical protein